MTSSVFVMRSFEIKRELLGRSLAVLSQTFGNGLKIPPGSNGNSSGVESLFLHSVADLLRNQAESLRHGYLCEWATEGRFPVRCKNHWVVVGLTQDRVHSRCSTELRTSAHDLVNNHFVLRAQNDHLNLRPSRQSA